MADNMIETVLKILEGVVAPSVAEIKADVQSQKYEMEFQFKAIMAAIETTRAQIALEHTKMYAELRERVAVIEAQLRPRQ